MKPNRCSCGETLVTRDEIVRNHCWHCAGLSWRLSLADAELAAVEAGVQPISGRLPLPQAS